jgi:hypothetical protein
MAQAIVRRLEARRFGQGSKALPPAVVVVAAPVEHYACDPHEGKWLRIVWGLLPSLSENEYSECP